MLIPENKEKRLNLEDITPKNSPYHDGESLTKTDFPKYPNTEDNGNDLFDDKDERDRYIKN